MTSTSDQPDYSGPDDPRTRGINNRFVLLVAGFIIHLCIGQVYGFSVFTSFLRAKGPEWHNAGFVAYGLGLGGLGYSAMFAGKLGSVIGPKNLGFVCAALFLIGHLGCALFVHLNNMVLFLCFLHNRWYFFWSRVSFFSFSYISYVCPVPPIMRWFPDMKGLAGGVAVSGFGLGPSLSGLINTPLVENYGLVFTFTAVAIYGSIAIAIASFFIRNPPPNYVPPKMNPAASSAILDEPDITAKEVFKTSLYYRCWFTQAIACFCGVSLISAIVPILEEVFELTPRVAGRYLVIFSFFNTGGRFWNPAISDYVANKGYNRKWMFAYYTSSQAIVSTLIAISMPNGWLIAFVAFACVVYANMGGSFGTLPALLSDTFGSKVVGSIFGVTLSAWATSGLVGPILASFMRDRAEDAVTDGDLSGIYSPFFYLLTIVLFVGFLISLTIHRYKVIKVNTDDQVDVVIEEEDVESKEKSIEVVDNTEGGDLNEPEVKSADDQVEDEDVKKEEGAKEVDNVEEDHQEEDNDSEDHSTSNDDVIEDDNVAETQPEDL
ncbi:hypothetical protein GEMRC1_004918 [Eukaryota sp. GEM-RC1]